MNQFISQYGRRFLVVLCFLFGASSLQAEAIPVANTGFTVSIPENFATLRLEDSPGVLLQADSTTGESSLQVVAAPPGVSEEALASDYEAKMSGIFQNLEIISAEQVEINQKSRLLKNYSAQSNQGTIHITALFYASTPQPMIVHAVDISGKTQVMRDMVTSLTPPTPNPMQAQESETADLNHENHPIKSAVSVSAATSSASTAAIPPTPEGYQWFTEKFSGLRWLVPQTWQVEQADSSIVFVPPKDDTLFEAGGIQVQNLSRKIERFSTIEKATEELHEFVKTFNGSMILNEDHDCNGMRCRLVELTVVFNEKAHHHIWFVYFVRPDMITLIQYDTFGVAEKLDSQVSLMRAHLKLGLNSVREMQP